MSQEITQVASVSDPDDRADAMHNTMDQWLEDLADLADEARASDHLQRWLDVQSRFHDYSFRNTLLITQQCPDASRVAGYRTWQEEFDRQVTEGESAIWIWAPIITERCPTCHDGEAYHDADACTDDTPTEEWERGVVGFKPVPVFDVSQTEGEPLPDLRTEAHGDGAALRDRLLDRAPNVGGGVTTRLVDSKRWQHGNARGVCAKRSDGISVEVEDRRNAADVARTLIHEYAHVLMHLETGASLQRSRAEREVEAEAVAYVVGEHFGLDCSNSAFYVARWQDEDDAAIQDRLERISQTACELIDLVD